jgi:bifunctional non-homologous end joining protein LigD
VADDALFTIAGQEFKVTSPERVSYPATGTTKLDVMRYYAQVSEVMLPGVPGRPATRKRWPDGVDGASFFVRDLQPGTPAWLTRIQIPHGSGGPKFYPVFDPPAALARLGQVAALELHVPQWRIEQTSGPGTTGSIGRHPDRVVFDLDPVRPRRGPGRMRRCRPCAAGTARSARPTGGGRYQRQQRPAPLRSDGRPDHQQTGF